MRRLLLTGLLAIARAAAAEPDDEIRPAAAAPLQYAPSSGALAAQGANPAWDLGPASGLINPALLGKIKEGSLGFDYQASPGNIQRQGLGAGLNLGAAGSACLVVDTVDYGSLEAFDDNGDPLGSAAVRDMSASLAWGRHWGRLGLGLEAAARREDLAGEASWLSFAGIGASLEGPWSLSLGISWLGPLDPELGPGLARLGIATQAWQGLKLGMAANFRPGLEQELQLSAAYTLFERMQMRAGQRWSLPDPSLGALAGASLGLGFALEGWDLDYAYLPMGELGQSHQLSLSWRFTQPAASRAEAPLAQAPQSPPLPPSEIQPKEGLALQIVSAEVTQGLQWEREGRWRKAFDSYQAALKRNDKDLPAWRAMAGAYERLGKMGYARQCYERLASLDPKDLGVKRWLESHSVRAAAP